MYRFNLIWTEGVDTRQPWTSQTQSKSKIHMCTASKWMVGVSLVLEIESNLWRWTTTFKLRCCSCRKPQWLDPAKHFTTSVEMLKGTNIESAPNTKFLVQLKKYTFPTQFWSLLDSGGFTSTAQVLNIFCTEYVGVLHYKSVWFFWNPYSHDFCKRVKCISNMFH